MEDKIIVFKYINYIVSFLIYSCVGPKWPLLRPIGSMLRDVSIPMVATVMATSYSTHTATNACTGMYLGLFRLKRACPEVTRTTKSRVLTNFTH
jgi:hypothetical protein